nr:DUF1641 domain-containing protein [Desulfobacterales bacterium]
MTNEELILERLDRIESQLAPLADSAKGLKELKDDLVPRANEAVKFLITELVDVESSFQLEDLSLLVKKGLRSVRNLVFALEQLGNLIDFALTVEPLLKSTVPQMINYLDDLEQRGVFRIIKAMMGVRAKIAAAYTPKDIEEIGDGLVGLLGLARKLTHPEAMAFLEKIIDIPVQEDLSTCKRVGPVGLIAACCKSEVKEGLGVLIEVIKGLGKIKG